MRKSRARAVAGKEAWLGEGGRETATSSQRGTAHPEELDFPLKASPVIHGTGSDCLLMFVCSCVLILYSHALKLWCGVPIVSFGGTLMYVIQKCSPWPPHSHAMAVSKTLSHLSVFCYMYSHSTNLCYGIPYVPLWDIYGYLFRNIRLGQPTQTL